MSLQFNDTTNFKGIVQIYEKEIGADRGHVSGNANRLKEIAADVNLTWDAYLTIAMQASGRWQFDDSNHTGDAIYKVNLVSGTQSYALTTDETDTALILDVHRVAILTSATATEYVEIRPIDEQSDRHPGGLLLEQADGGVPGFYDKTGNTLKLDPNPDYSATLGLKVYINREPSYFVSGDTTKMPGCPGNHHRYFALRPAFDYARRNNLVITNLLANEVAKLERDIKADFAKRARDERSVMKGRGIKYI